jgi:two-component system KDP operon response regulator KdpE
MRSVSEPTPLVLVVDDDPDMLRVIRGVLEDEGLAVATAADGQRALALAAERAPDLAVLDVGLPVLDGHQVAAGLRDLLGGAFPVLAITADGHTAEKARHMRAYVGLRKPFELNDLVAEVWRGLGRPLSR